MNGVTQAQTEKNKIKLEVIQMKGKRRDRKGNRENIEGMSGNSVFMVMNQTPNCDLISISIYKSKKP